MRINPGLQRFNLENMSIESLYAGKGLTSFDLAHGKAWIGTSAGDLSTGYLSDSDNDGLWTSMYLGAEVFRYAVTRTADTLTNISESLDAMERLYPINPIPGFPSHSFERRGFIKSLSDPERWQHAPDPEWDWKATTSSDEAIGTKFSGTNNQICTPTR